MPLGAVAFPNPPSGRDRPTNRLGEASRGSPGMHGNDEAGSACAAAGRVETALRDGERIGKIKMVSTRIAPSWVCRKLSEGTLRTGTSVLPAFLLPRNCILDAAMLSKNRKLTNLGLFRASRGRNGTGVHVVAAGKFYGERNYSGQIRTSGITIYLIDNIQEKGHNLGCRLLEQFTFYGNVLAEFWPI